MDQKQITEALRQFMAYKYAINSYERHNPYPQAGVANYDAMPSGSGAPERFFAIVGKPADMGGKTFQDRMDYMRYKSAVVEIEGAFAVLTEDEESVIKLKWLHDINLKQIAERKGFSEKTIKRLHKRGMNKLVDALRFVQLPEIETHEYAKVGSF